MKKKKILTILFAVALCFSSVLPAFATEPDDYIQTEVYTETLKTEPTSEQTDADEPITETSTEVSDENSTKIEDDENAQSIPAEDVTEPTTLEETVEPVSEPAETKTPSSNENRVTIYFKDLKINCKVKIKNTATGKETKFELNKENRWTFSDILDPGTYKIVSFKPVNSQFKIKRICDEKGNEIEEFKVIKTGEGIQVINLCPETKVSAGFLAFFGNHIILDICVVLLIVLYVVNAKGYRIPILSNWIDNYRH